MVNFPTSLDSLSNPAAGNSTNSPSHASQHGNANDAIEAIEAKVGIGATTPAANTLLFGTGAGTSAWQGLTSAQLLAILSDETGTGSVVFATSPTLVTPKVDTINENTPANGVTIDGLNIKDNALNTNNSVVTANITDANVTAPKMNNSGTWNSSWAWASWTPTLTNLSGGTLNYAKYSQIGKTVFFRFRYTLAGAGISGVPRISLPVNLHADYAQTTDTITVTGQLNDATGQRWLPYVVYATSSSLDIFYFNALANLTTTSSVAPFTWAVNDQIMLTGHYEAA